MRITSKVEGFAELARALNELPEAVGRKTMREALKKAAEPIRGMAAAIMVRSSDAPHAADNIGITLGRSGFSVAIGPTKEFYYWRFRELGTRFQTPRPAMRPAFDTQAPQALGILGRELWAALKGVAESNMAGRGGRYL